MKETYKVLNSNGTESEIDLIGFFRVPQLEKEYAMYSLLDNDPDNSMGGVLLGEVIRFDNGEIKILDILREEVDLVVAFYNEISTQIGE